MSIPFAFNFTLFLTLTPLSRSLLLPLPPPLSLPLPLPLLLSDSTHTLCADSIVLLGAQIRPFCYFYSLPTNFFDDD